MRHTKKSTTLMMAPLCVVLVTGLVAAGCAQTQPTPYPAKPIELVVAAAPGGITDLFARMMADELSTKWHVPINVVNKTGGNSVPAVQYVMQAPPDGYTLLADGAGTSSAQVLLPDLPYKIEDRTFIARVAANSHGFMVPATAPWKDLNEMIQDVRKDPAAFKWVTVGGSSTIDITTRQFLAAIGVDFTKTSPVLFTGAGPGMEAVAGGSVSLVVTNPRTELPFVQVGKTRILAVTSPERLKWLPDVPTTRELGLPQVNYQFWGGFSGPPGLPELVVNTWVNAIDELIRDRDFSTRLTDKVGMYPLYAGPKDFKRFVLTESQELKQLYPPK
jgi:tripartite-type tricarboxylate transporter receptor subunit TctC